MKEQALPFSQLWLLFLLDDFLGLGLREKPLIGLELGVKVFMLGAFKDTKIFKEGLVTETFVKGTFHLV